LSIFAVRLNVQPQPSVDCRSIDTEACPTFGSTIVSVILLKNGYATPNGARHAAQDRGEFRLPPAGATPLSRTPRQRPSSSRVFAGSLSKCESTVSHRYEIDFPTSHAASAVTLHARRWPLELEAEFDRPGPHVDAPFGVAYPFFNKMTETIVLPNVGQAQCR